MNRYTDDVHGWNQLMAQGISSGGQGVPIPTSSATSSSRGEGRVHHREMRGSRGGSRPSVTDESREATTTERRSSSATSRGGGSSVQDQANSGSMRDLSFDLEQPWQRSLLRELENIERAGGGSEGKHARQRSYNKILLGRGQSGDYLVEYDDMVMMDDDTTVLTDASSSIPLRSQAIHRTMSGAAPPAIALFKDEDEDEYGAWSTDSSSDHRLAVDPVAAYRGVPAYFGDHASAWRDSRRVDDGGGLGLAYYGGAVHASTPPTTTASSSSSGVALSRANALLDDRATTSVATSTSGTDPINCMCIGFNFLESWFPSNNNSTADLVTIPSYSNRPKRARTSRNSGGSASILGLNHRRSYVLDRVKEEEITTPDSIFVYRDEEDTATGPTTTRTNNVVSSAAIVSG